MTTSLKCLRCGRDGHLPSDCKVPVLPDDRVLAADADALTIAANFQRFAQDHAPDGWPAVQQRELDAAARCLLDQHAEIARLKGQQPQAEAVPAFDWGAAVLIVRDCCESEKSDPDHPDTICISVQDLTAIVQQYAAPQQAEAGPAWTTEQITAVAQPIAVAIAQNCQTAPQLVFPHLFIGLKELLTKASAKWAKVVPITSLTINERKRLLEAANHLDGDGHFMDGADADWAAAWIRQLVGGAQT